MIKFNFIGMVKTGETIPVFKQQVVLHLATGDIGIWYGFWWNSYYGCDSALCCFGIKLNDTAWYPIQSIEFLGEL